MDYLKRVFGILAIGIYLLVVYLLVLLAERSDSAAAVSSGANLRQIDVSITLFQESQNRNPSSFEELYPKYAADYRLFQNPLKSQLVHQRDLQRLYFYLVPFFWLVASWFIWRAEFPAPVTHISILAISFCLLGCHHSLSTYRTPAAQKIGDDYVLLPLEKMGWPVGTRPLLITRPGSQAPYGDAYYWNGVLVLANPQPKSRYN